MNWRLANCCALSWAVVLCLAATPASGAKPRKSAVPANAKKIDLFEAIDGNKVKMSLTVAARSTGSLVLINTTEDEPFAVEVPLTMGASPIAPAGANRFYYAGSFGTPAAPQSLAVAVNPQWSAPVEKKGRKSNVRTKKKKDEKEAKDEKKDDEKKDGEKKDEAKAEKKDDAAGGSSLVATVPLPPGGSQTLPLFILGLNMKKPQAAYGPFKPEELEKVTQAPEMKKLLELLVQNKIPGDVAQTLAWYYNERPTWDELKMSGFVTPGQVEIAQKFADVVEGRAAAPPAEETTGKKKKR